jgi:hypothetical protein
MVGGHMSIPNDIGELVIMKLLIRNTLGTKTGGLDSAKTALFEI